MAERPPAGEGLAACPSTPNCVCSADSGRAAIAPMQLAGDPDESWRALVEHVGGRGGVRIEQSDERYLHAVATTSLLRFKDDVEFLRDTDSGRVDVRSASRIGYSDLGANRRRVEAIRSDLAELGIIDAG